MNEDKMNCQSFNSITVTKKNIYYIKEVNDYKTMKF